MASFFLLDGPYQYQCEHLENDLCLLNTFNGESYICPNISLCTGHVLWYYDEYHNKYWKYIISTIIKIIDSRIICKIAFSDNYQRIIAFMRDDLTSTDPMWILRGNLVIDPILEYGLCNIVGPELESIYAVIIKSLRKSENNECLYYIRQPDENELQALLHGENFAIISVVVDNFFRKDVYDRWKYFLEYLDESTSHTDNVSTNLVCEVMESPKEVILADSTNNESISDVIEASTNDDAVIEASDNNAESVIVANDLATDTVSDSISESPQEVHDNIVTDVVGEVSKCIKDVVDKVISIRNNCVIIAEKCKQNLNNDKEISVKTESTMKKFKKPSKKQKSPKIKNIEEVERENLILDLLADFDKTFPTNDKTIYDKFSYLANDFVINLKMRDKNYILSEIQKIIFYEFPELENKEHKNKMAKVHVEIKNSTRSIYISEGDLVKFIPAFKEYFGSSISAFSKEQRKMLLVKFATMTRENFAREIPIIICRKERTTTFNIQSIKNLLLDTYPVLDADSDICVDKILYHYYAPYMLGFHICHYSIMTNKIFDLYFEMIAVNLKWCFKLGKFSFENLNQEFDLSSYDETFQCILKGRIYAAYLLEVAFVKNPLNIGKNVNLMKYIYIRDRLSFFIDKSAYCKDNDSLNPDFVMSTFEDSIKTEYKRLFLIKD